ncbi:MAG: tripartite tricarboxylate transporter substrate binding protein BugD [Acetobacteraceae bacterium]|nr:tripartite tricarboxylate transporter substrate binding protein BugD [Acetobacteraceae bacterium]
MLRRALFAAAILAAASLPGASLPAAAQGWPQRPVSVIVPFAAGGPTDAVARLVSEAMGKDLGQNLIVENVGGAGGTLGAARVASARPDGYTLLLHHIGMATIPILYRRLPYDPMGFETIGLITAAPMTMVVRKDHPAKTFQELVAWIKEKKEDANLGNAGLGAASQLCGTLLQYLLQTPMTTVPFRGTGPAMTELLAGRIDVMCDQTTNTVEHIKAGAIRVLAVTTPARLPVLPDVPTTTELGMPDLQIAIWHGFYAPKGTPAAIIERASAALRTALRDDKVIARFAELGLTPEPQERATPAAHRAFWEAEVAKWRPVLQSAGQYAD